MAQKMIPHNPDFLLMEGNNLTKEKLNWAGRRLRSSSEGKTNNSQPSGGTRGKQNPSAREGKGGKGQLSHPRTVFVLIWMAWINVDTHLGLVQVELWMATGMWCTRYICDQELATAAKTGMRDLGLSRNYVIAPSRG
jgi:hypothetical protein